MDEADIAQRNQEYLEGLALKTQLAAIPRGQAADACEDCGDDIPEMRRRVAPGCTRCINCQSIFERKQREFR